MARPGKAIFDVAMMAGWAFAAVLTGLVALTMVDDTGDSATNPSVVATLGNNDSRLVTGSIDRQRPVDPLSTGSIQSNNPQIAKQVARQNESFNPFSDQVNRQSNQIRDVLNELRALKREVAAFHISTKRLRNENDLLRQRLVKLEQAKETARNPVRIVTLPKRDDSRSPFLHSADNNMPIDTNPTGSIAPTRQIPESGPAFDPFKNDPQSKVKISREPLNMDLTVEGPNGRMMLPKTKPTKRQAAAKRPPNGLKPKSEVVPAPQQALSSSQTSFALDLGQFVSIATLDGAWNEISASQRALIGDLKPLSKVVRNSDDKLALNLIAGPIQNAAQAATLCAKLKYRGYACRVSVYQGQALASR